LKTKSVLLSILLMILIIAAGFGFLEAQTASRKTARIPPKNEEEIIHDIQDLEKSLRAAFIDGKSAWWERHLDENYTGLNPDGQTAKKAATIQLYSLPDLKYEEMNMGDMSARIYGDCVIASGKSTVKGSYKGQDFSGDYYFVHIWVKEGTDWKLASSQATKLPG
jgi:hypothetical protein